MPTYQTFTRFMSRLNGTPYKRRDERTTHGASGKRLTSFAKKHFICWDGEGTDNPDKPTEYIYNQGGNLVSTTERILDQDDNLVSITQHQLYALLMNNENTCIIDERGIPTLMCLDTIMNSTEDKRAIHVCFGASYDCNMMLRDLPDKLKIQLHQGKSIDYGKYRIAYRARKSLEIKEYADMRKKFRLDKKGVPHRHYKKSITLWDVYSFFDTSFVETLKKYFINCPVPGMPDAKVRYTEIIAKIKEGKDKRGTFTNNEIIGFVKPYCKLEVDALHELMMTLHGYLSEIGLVLNRWDGAGACAAALLKKYGVKEHISEKNIPEEVIRAAEYAFFGGRIETMMYGNTEDTVYHDDINSAYPSAKEDLPSLKYGDWIHYGTEANNIPLCQLNEISVCLVSWRMLDKRGRYKKDNVICPFPWRDKIGNVFFPPYGKAWLWLPEVKVAKEKFQEKGLCELYIHETWTFQPIDPDNNNPPKIHKPFDFVPALYLYRQKLVEALNGAEKVIKLALNSCYGKLAQSIGYSLEKQTKPPYHNLIIAGMITSKTRAKLVDASMQCPEDIIMLATDGIYSRKKLQLYAPKEKILGAWEHTTHDYMTVVASGVYWYRTNEVETSYSRGFNRYSIMRDMVLDAWSRGETSLKCETTRFVGLGSAFGLRRFDLHCTWRTVYRDLGLNMDKVAKRTEPESNKRIRPDKQLRRTYAAVPKQLKEAENLDFFPYQHPKFMMSHKYAFRWDTEQGADTFDGVRMRTYLEECAHSQA